MKKLFTFLALGVGLIMSSCSSDEPGQTIKNDNEVDGNAMYLSINITDVDAIGRAGEEGELPDSSTSGNEGDFVQGKGFENKVDKALFYFFDAQGTFVCKASVWSGGNATTDNNNNVEYIGKNVVVLKGLKDNSQPKYLLTVLNPPAELEEYAVKDVTKLEDFRKQLMNCITKDGYFTMSTSSFMHDDASQKDFYDSNYPYVNVIPAEGYLIKCPEDQVPENFENTLDIYVERLAAKFTLDPASLVTKEYSLTIAGAENNEHDSDGQAKTKVYITLDRVGVMQAEKESYLSKDISGLDGLATSWEAWNVPVFHRSFWGKSVNYGAETNEGLETVVRYFDIKNDKYGIAARYANETTKPFAAIRNEDGTVKSNLIPHFVISATVSLSNSADAKGENLVEFQGIVYLEAQFKKFALSKVPSADLNYHIQTEGGENPKYRQVDDSDLGFMKYFDANGVHHQGVFVPYFKNGGSTKLYSYNPDAEQGNKYTELPANSFESLNSALKNYFENSNDYPIYFNGGQMTYTVPVQHLLGEDNVYSVTKDGEFGIVRNHWYQLSVDKVLKLGTGVFDPSEGGDIIEIKDNPQFSMAASVKLLSWKIVKQSVNL